MARGTDLFDHGVVRELTEGMIDRRVQAVVRTASAGRANTSRRGSRITGADRARLTADLRARYEHGESIRSLAEGSGRSYGFVHRLLVDAEVPLRPRGGSIRRKTA